MPTKVGYRAIGIRERGRWTVSFTIGSSEDNSTVPASSTFVTSMVDLNVGVPHLIGFCDAVNILAIAYPDLGPI